MKTIVNTLPKDIILPEQIPSTPYLNTCFVAIKRGVLWGIVRSSEYIRDFYSVSEGCCYLETPFGFTRGPDDIERYNKTSIVRYIQFLLDKKYEVLMFDDFYEMIDWIAKEKPIFSL